MKKSNSNSKMLTKEEFMSKINDIKKKIYFIARSKVNKMEDVEDIIQETIYQGYKNINKLRSNDKFDYWIIGILINVCNQFYRNKVQNYELDSNITSVDNDLFDVERKIDFINLLTHLNEQEGMILSLYYSNDLSISDISKIMNLNENTVKTKIKRAKQKLKEYIERCEKNGKF